jgi:ADP-heptose:LPS heptosyltransferase
MSRLRSVFKAAIYSPLAPLSINMLCRFMRSVGWLPARSRSSKSVRRVLVVQAHNSLGDLVLSIPFLQAIHRLWSGAEIDLVVGNAMTEIFESIPFVTRVIGYTPSKLRQPFARYQDTVRLALLSHRHLRSPYDVALDPRWDSDVYAYLARTMCFFSGASHRLAYSGAVDRKDPSLDQFLTRAAIGGSHEHELIRKMRLFERLGLTSEHIEDREQLHISEALREVSETRKDEALQILQAAGLQGGERYGVLAPSASAEKKIWPIELLSDAVQALSAKTGLRFFAVGSARETERCERLAHMNPGVVMSLAGKTGVLQLCAILSDASLFVGNDSGPAHISGMLGRNTVVVSSFPAELNGIDHMTAPARFRPCGPLVRVVQPQHPLPPCQDFCGFNEPHCVTQVRAQQVLVTCLQLLEEAVGAENGEVKCSTRK